MSTQLQQPTLRQFNEKKVKINVWVPPIVRKKLEELSEEDGQATSRRLYSAALGVTFPEMRQSLVDAPIFGSIDLPRDFSSICD